MLKHTTDEFNCQNISSVFESVFLIKKKSYTFCKVIDKPKDAIPLPDSKRRQNICNPVSWSSSSPEKFSKAFNRTLQIYSKESVFLVFVYK